MCWHQQRLLTPDTSAPGAARTMINEVVHDQLGTAPWVADVEFDATLIASELVTNAIQTADCTRLALAVHLHRSRMRLTVSDDGTGMPHLVFASSSDARGRGLALVAALALAWGVEAVRAGKEVWADLALPDAAAGSGRPAWRCENDVPVFGG